MLGTYQLLNGNSIEVLKTLPDKSVNTCVTSPPYFGLRDYGTAKWVGGDPNCDHVADASKTKKFGNEEFNKNRPSREQTKIPGYYKEVCPKCGAVRVDEQIGIEKTPDEYIANLVAIFEEVKRVLKDDGTLWVNIGDTYNGNKTGNTEIYKNKKLSEASDGIHKKQWGGCKQKDLIGIPWMLAFALRDAGWYLRNDIIWQKVNPMPESVTDRCTKSHEYIFLFAKQPNYYFDYKAIREEAHYDGRKDTVLKGSNKYDGFAGAPHERWKFEQPTGIKFGGNKYGDNNDPKYAIYSGNTYTQKYVDGIAVRNKRDVWTVPVASYSEAHFATFSEKLIEPCILAGCPVGGTVLDPFNGAATTGLVSIKNDRNYIGIDLNQEYIALSKKRLEALKETAEIELDNGEVVSVQKKELF